MHSSSLPSAAPAPEALALFDAFPGAHMLLALGPDFVIEAASDAYLAATLTQREHVVGRPLFEVFPDNPATPQAQSTHQLHASLRQVLATGQPHTMALQQYDVPDPARPGHFAERYWQPANWPVRDAQGQLRHVLHTAVNVTEQVLADQQLRASQAREQVAQQHVERSQQQWRTLTDAIDHLVWTTDPAGAADYFNAQWYAYTGASWDASRDLGWRAAAHPADQPGLAAHETQARQQGAGYQTEVRLRAAAGDYRWFMLRVHPLPDALTEQVRWFGTATDIHERKTQEQALLEASQLLRATLDSSADLVQVFKAVRGEEGDIIDFEWTLVNTVALSYYRQPLLGQRLCEVSPGVVETGIFAHFVEVVETGEAQRYEQEYRYEQFDGWFEQAAVPLGDGLVTTTADITARKRAEQLLRRTNADLDTFVYTASHDLKAPITNIEGILTALRETLPGEVQQDDVIAHLLGLLDHTVSRFLTTIDQLTDLARLQQTYEEPAERLTLAPIVADVVADLAPAIAAAAAQLHIEVPADLAVSFAPATLRSVVYNLLSNAIKYRDPARPAQVWLRAEYHPAAVVLTVRDNGLGLTESQLGRLFGVFQRLHTHVEGTGVGLYMIKRLIENAGARITVTSAPGVGSTFTVTFPT